MSRKPDVKYCRHCARRIYSVPQFDNLTRETVYRLYDADGKEHRCPEGAKERGEAQA